MHEGIGELAELYQSGTAFSLSLGHPLCLKSVQRFTAYRCRRH
jgi:hypothetical protein